MLSCVIVHALPRPVLRQHVFFADHYILFFIDSTEFLHSVLIALKIAISLNNVWTGTMNIYVIQYI